MPSPMTPTDDAMQKTVAMERAIDAAMPDIVKIFSAWGWTQSIPPNGLLCEVVGAALPHIGAPGREEIARCAKVAHDAVQLVGHGEERLGWIRACRYIEGAILSLSPSGQGTREALDDLNFIKAFWRAEPSCLHLACDADCNPMTTHCGRTAEVFAEHNAKVTAPSPQAGGLPEGEVAWLREVDAGTDNACWVVCTNGDPGAVAFSPAPPLGEGRLEQEIRQKERNEILQLIETKFNKSGHYIAAAIRAFPPPPLVAEPGKK